MAGDGVGLAWTLEIPEVKLGEVPWNKVVVKEGSAPTFPANQEDGAIPISKISFSISHDLSQKIRPTPDGEKKKKKKKKPEDHKGSGCPCCHQKKDKEADKIAAFYSKYEVRDPEEEDGDEDGPSKPEWQKVDFDKEMDGTSVTLYNYCLYGQAIKVATFVGWVVLPAPQGKRVPVFWLQLERCGLRSAGLNSESLSESYSLEFDLAMWGYMERSGKTVSQLGWARGDATAITNL